MPWASPALKLAASAWKLWSARSVGGPGPVTFPRVLGTTVLNPKAMLVGTTMVPAVGLPGALPWVAGYACMSAAAGLAWVAFGSMLPSALRRRAAGAAAVVLAVFSAMAAGSALA